MIRLPLRWPFFRRSLEELTILVQVPYGNLEKPSMALGLLKAILAQAGVNVEVDYCNLEFAREVGVGRYHSLSKLYVEQIGEWTFAGAAFPSFTPDHGEYLGMVQQLALPGKTEAGRQYVEELWRVRRKADAFIERTATRLVARRPKIVACSSMFQQHCAALALLRRVKELDPRITTVIGGANCEGPMGVATLRAFPWLDVVVSGEADELVTDLFKALLAGGSDPADYQPPGGVYLRRQLADGQGQELPITTGRTEELDRTPQPDFTDYFATLEKYGLTDVVKPGLLIETSRGCWWGARKHCTFCGLNGGSMNYRSKSQDRVLEELDALAERHQLDQFQVVDNILDMGYFQELLPNLAERQAPYHLFYETKPNLTRQQVEVLHAAGVRWLQPGIESLHDEALETMNKGTTSLINIRLLKWARELGLTIYWNILHGIPGEKNEWYTEMAHLIPGLVHLQAPQGLIRIRFERFSPYHARPEDFGLELQPAWPYRFIYPLAEELLEQLVYRFDDIRDTMSRTSYFDNRIGAVNSNDAPGVGELRLHLKLWRYHQDSPEPPILSMEELGEETRIRDTRPCATAENHTLRGLHHQVHHACLAGNSLTGILRALTAAGIEPGPGELEGVLSELGASRLVVPLGDRYLALAVPGEPPALPALREFPGGYIDVFKGLAPAGARPEARSS